MRGFTLIEILLVIAVFGILLLIGIPSLRSVQQEHDLQREAQKIIVTLQTAQSRSVGSLDASSYGVFFDAGSDQYVLFQGTSYATRDADQDEIFPLPSKLEFDPASLSETSFSRVSGLPSQTGTVTVRTAANPTEQRVIRVSAAGLAELGSGNSPSDDDRIKDSRHVHVAYDAFIDTATESLEVAFAPGTAEEVIVTVPLSSFLQGSQLEWRETTMVGGEAQVLEIRTHRLNDPDTEFSITRDGRENTKSLRIAIESDASGTLIEYDEDGQTTQGSSINAFQPQWQ